MLEVEIKGLQGEGKTRTAIAISDYWNERGRKCHVIEGYKPGQSINMDLTGIDVLIKVIQ